MYIPAPMELIISSIRPPESLDGEGFFSACFRGFGDNFFRDLGDDFPVVFPEAFPETFLTTFPAAGLAAGFFCGDIALSPQSFSILKNLTGLTT
jgi:hypothetical protein